MNIYARQAYSREFDAGETLPQKSELREIVSSIREHVHWEETRCGVVFSPTLGQ